MAFVAAELGRVRQPLYRPRTVLLTRGPNAAHRDPAGAPKPSRPGPGRPLGSKNRARPCVMTRGESLPHRRSIHRPAHHKVGTKPRRVTLIAS